MSLFEQKKCYVSKLCDKIIAFTSDLISDIFHTLTLYIAILKYCRSKLGVGLNNMLTLLFMPLLREVGELGGPKMPNFFVII